MTNGHGGVRANAGRKRIEAPDYEFNIIDDYAVGRLADGTFFKIDIDFIPEIEKYRWCITGYGYIISPNVKPKNMSWLHRLIMRCSPNDIVDHINRDKTDCRCRNLRLVTDYQNAWNKNKRAHNTIGFSGVRQIPSGNYQARIMYKYKDISLGSYPSLAQAGQAYNIAAQLLFGEYVGNLNDVEDTPTREFIEFIENKCKLYMTHKSMMGGENAMANGHGGARSNAGRPRKALAEAIMDGTRPSRLRAVDFDNIIDECGANNLTDDTTPTAPEVMEYLMDAQKDGEKLLAEQFYNDIYKWLAERKCERLFEVSYLQRFAMQQARYVQLEKLISRHGFLAKTASGDARDNPLEAMALNRLKMVNQMQQSIEGVVRAYCETPYTGFPNSADPMEELLSGKK